MMYRLLAIASLATVVPAKPARAARVPFVGCAMDGQTGPVPAPTAGPTPDVPAAAAARLALYATGGPAPMAALAPRGWACFGTYGSNGSSLVVRPERVGWKEVTAGALRGPVIQLRWASGETSGRFEVAEVAARLFPAARGFVAGVEREGLLDRRFDRGPYPVDGIRHHGSYEALFTTPGGREGMGTLSLLAPGPLPIDGLARLYPAQGMDLHLLVARLAPADRPLVAYMIADAARR